MKHLLTIFLFLLFILPALAHVGDHEEEEEVTSTNHNDVLPFSYFSSGDWELGIVITVLWIVVLRGVYVLGVLLLGRVVEHKK